MNSILSLLFLFALIIYYGKNIISFKKNKKYLSEYENFFNISYALSNNTITNTYKKGSINYIPNITVNNDEDYISSERNLYDIFIPKSLNKSAENKVILFIYGGSWVSGEKSIMHPYCKFFAQKGYITVAITHTLCNSTAEDKQKRSVYRMLDEIDLCIKSIKNYLKNLNFNTNKLKLAISGHSSGSFLSMFYAYSRGNYSEIPLKLIVAIQGASNINFSDRLIMKNRNESLNNINKLEVIKELKLGNVIYKYKNDLENINRINLLTGSKFSENELNNMLDKNLKINFTNEDSQYLYYKLMKSINIIEFIKEENIPTLFIYAGKDDVIGIGHWMYVEDLINKFNIKNFDLLYMKNEGHSIPLENYNENDKKFIFNFANKYF